MHWKVCCRQIIQSWSTSWIAVDIYLREWWECLSPHQGVETQFRGLVCDYKIRSGVVGKSADSYFILTVTRQVFEICPPESEKSSAMPTPTPIRGTCWGWFHWRIFIKIDNLKRDSRAYFMMKTAWSKIEPLSRSTPLTEKPHAFHMGN